MNINFNSVINTLASKAKALALNVTEIELKVLDATNEDPWGPHGKDMQEIARAAEDPEKYNLIMNVISERLQMRDENWRLCYKALLLLEFMVKHGPWRVVDELNRSVSSLERLRDDFEYKDAQGRDQGINVRQRAGELAALVSNTDRVRQEREKAARNASKYRGLSSADVRGHGGGFGSGSAFGSTGGGGGGGYSGFGGGFGGGGGGASRSQGRSYGGTESVHVPSINGGGSSRTSGGAAGPSGRKADSFRGAPGSAGGSGAAGAGSGTDDPEDPFEATRRRIERLKAEGALPEPAPAPPPPGLADPPGAGAKAPKKLSDVKINPAVAATFASVALPPSSSSGSLGKLSLAPPPPPNAPLAGAAQHGSSSSLDLFGGKSDTLPTSKGAGSGTAAPPAEAAWDAAFGAVSVATAVPAPPTAAAAADPFDAFSSAAPAQPPPPAAATIAAPARAPLALDDFSDLGSSTTSLAAPPTVPTTGPDLFTALASSSAAAVPLPAAAVAAPRPPVPATNPDPFAALTESRAAPPQPMLLVSRPTPTPVPAFDAFGTSSAVAVAARTPQLASTGHPPAATAALGGDPFALLAVSAPSAAAPPARTVAAAAATFDPFAPSAATMASVPAPKPAAPAFDAFGPSVAAAHAPAGGFDEFFGAAPRPTARPSVSAGQPAADSFADPFAQPAFTPSGPAAGASGVGSAHPAANGAAMAMNKSGVAHGANAHKNHDPFAGLGF